MKLVDIPNYTMISNHRMNSKGGGTAILIRNGIPYKTRKDLDIFHEKIIESVFSKFLLKVERKSLWAVFITLQIICHLNLP